MSTAGDDEPEDWPLSEIDAHVGRKVRALRDGIRDSQENFARKVGMDPEDLRGVEAGTRRLGVEEIIALIRMFDLPPDYFDTDDPEEPGGPLSWSHRLPPPRLH